MPVDDDDEKEKVQKRLQLELWGEEAKKEEKCWRELKSIKKGELESVKHRF